MGNIFRAVKNKYKKSATNSRYWLKIKFMISFLAESSVLYLSAAGPGKWPLINKFYLTLAGFETGLFFLVPFLFLLLSLILCCVSASSIEWEDLMLSSFLESSLNFR